MTSTSTHRALVLASSQGIGHACAVALAQAGNQVILNGRDSLRLQQASQSLLEVSPQAQAQTFKADITQHQDRIKLMHEIEAVDILVLNMGGPPVSDKQLSADEWQHAFESMFLPMVELLDHYLLGMKNRGWGRVVMISSAAIRRPIPNLAVSGVFRTGLASLLALRATQIAPYGITINSLLPGRILTERQHSALEREAEKAGISKEEQLQLVSQHIPMRRLGEAHEMGSVCAFLCSDGAAYVTGQNILVDGGALQSVF